VKGVVLILGEERFLAHRAIEETLAKHSDLEVTRFHGKETSTAQVLDEVRTPTLLGGRRAAVVEHASELFDGKGLELLAAYAANPVKGSLLVLQTPKLDGRLKAAKALREAARVVECRPLRPQEVEKWIGSHARSEFELDVDYRAARALREHIGEDLGLLHTALARLQEQIAPRHRLEAADIAESTDEQRSPIIYEAGSALEGADLKGALAAVAACFDDGMRVGDGTVADERALGPIVLSTLHKTYVKLVRFAMFCEIGLERRDAALKAGTSPRAVHFFLQRASRHDRRKLVDRHRHFLEADRALKTDGEPRQVLERLLVALLA
jgi:DNA polymerase III delta subunit